MVSPLLPALGLARSLLPAVARLPESLLSGLGSLLGGASETTDRDPDFSGDDALVAQIAVQDPTVRAAVLREIDRRLSDDVPEDAATTARLERLRELLRRLEAEQTPPPAEPTADVERDFSGEPEFPPPSRAPAVAVAPVPAAPIARPADPPTAAAVVAKDLPEPVRAVSGAAAPPAPPASAPPRPRRRRAWRTPSWWTGCCGRRGSCSRAAFRGCAWCWILRSSARCGWTCRSGATSCTGRSRRTRPARPRPWGRG